MVASEGQRKRERKRGKGFVRERLASACRCLTSRCETSHPAQRTHALCPPASLPDSCSFNIANTYMHDLTFAVFSENSVFSNGRGNDINVDMHRGGKACSRSVVLAHLPCLPHCLPTQCRLGTICLPTPVAADCQ